ncbi:hypothetical protein OG623_25870 [Streptomyces sp. NBC_01012]|nr:hypothetical protein OG623_25870 [Streptomyces sp. NBC_01012]
MTTPKQQLLIRSAARNNAEWCAAMSRSHDVEGEFGPHAWTARTRTPPYYPDAVTLLPGADPAALTERIDTTAPGATVKDSFADLDLTDAGFDVLFEAQWIHRPAGPPAIAPALAWDVVDDPATLRAWALAWDDGNEAATDLFRPELLDDPATFVLAGQSPAGHVVSGAVASRSDDVVGISNLFPPADTPGTPDDPGTTDAHGAPNTPAAPDAAHARHTAWPAALDAAHRLFPGLPVVGYEHGQDLATAIRHGLRPLAPLRIWLRR